MTAPGQASLRTLLAAATLALGLHGCADAGGMGPTAATAQDGGAAIGKSDGIDLPDYVVRADGVLDSTAFRGVRRVKQVHRVPGSPDEVLEVREEVGADGLGAYTIDLMDTLSLPTSMDASLFPITHARSTDVYWRLRDFRIRDAGRLAQNYTVTELPGMRQVAGFLCRRVDFLRRQPAGDRPGHYVAEMDPTTGFVLGVREYDDAGQLLQEMVYESFSYRASLDGLDLNTGLFQRTSLDLNASLDGVVGFEVLVPDVLPAGFALADAVTFHVPDAFDQAGDSYLDAGDWVRFEATDGLESVVFAHGSTLASLTGYVQSQMRVLTEGLWEFGFGRVAGVPVVVSGRVTADDFRRLVESAF